MATPQTTDDLLQLVRKSGLVEEQQLAEFIAAHQQDGSLGGDPKAAVAALIRHGLITAFHGEQFLLGKWKGFTLGKYRLLERIGVGGMGQIFLCEHTYMRRRVAIKVLPPTKAQDPVSLARFYREARVASALEHPNIVKTYDIDQDANLHFLVMEYVDGTSLLEIVKKFGPLNVLRACHYVRQACQGLQYAHTAGMIHRDIKPGNIMVDRQGTAKLLDMGLARFYRDEKDQLTLKYDDKNVLGTADYVAPEQTRDSRNIDIRADIYGMGATFYYILTGQPPFPEPTVAEKLIAHQTKKPRPIRELRPEIPVGLAKIIEKMMAKDPKDRFQTPQDVIDALEIWTQQPIDPPPEEEMPKLSPAAMKPNFGSATPAVPMPSAAMRSTTSSAGAESSGTSRAGFRSAPISPASLEEGRFAPLGSTASRHLNPSASMVDILLPRGTQPRLPSPAAAETHPLPAPPDPTPQPKPPQALAPPAPATVPPVSTTSAPGLIGAAPTPAPTAPPTTAQASRSSSANRLGSALPRLGDSERGHARVVPPPLPPSAQGVTIPLPPSPPTIAPPPPVPVKPLPVSGPPEPAPVVPPVASPEAPRTSPTHSAPLREPAPPAPKPSKPTIELPKLRSFQGATVPLMNLSGASAPPPAGVFPPTPPITKPSPLETTSRVSVPQSPPTLAPESPRPQGLQGPGLPPIPNPNPILAPLAPPPPPPVVPPIVAPAATRLSSTPVGKPQPAPTYKPPTVIPFFDQPIIPPEPGLFTRLARWFFLVLISSGIGAALGVAIWYYFFRIQG